MITSLLDNDFYAFTQANAIHNNGDADLQVRYQFRNRTFAVPLARRIKMEDLKTEIELVRKLHFRAGEISYLRMQGIFSDDWLKTLEDFHLPEVDVWQENGHLQMQYEGNWGEAIFWESMLLSMVNEMYYKRFGVFLEEGERRLTEKIAYLGDRQTLKFVEFGTRRRFSSSWQHYVTHKMQAEIPELLLGTSNVLLAANLGLKPYGTMAHQLFMVYTAMQLALMNTADVPGNAIREGINDVLMMWLNAYESHPQMLTVLPDTYTTPAFVELADTNLVSQFSAFRQDSGDPIAVGKLLVHYAKDLGHSRPKIMFSDSLDVRRMSVLEDHFTDVDMVSGWGTNLTNDLGYEPLSIVIKPSAVKVGADWLPCVKLSDDPQKVTGDAEPYLRLI